MIPHGAFQPALSAWAQANAAPNTVMSSNSSVWGHGGATQQPPIHSGGCEGSPHTSLNNASFAWGYGGGQAPLMPNGRSESSPLVNVKTMSSSERKKFLIDYLMKHVDHDDLLNAALLVVCNNGLPGSFLEEQAALDEDARAAQAPPFPQQESAPPSFAKAAPKTMQSPAPPPPPPPMAAPSLPEVMDMQANEAWLNAVMAENFALKHELLEKSQSSVQHQQPAEMQLPVRPSLADLLPEPTEHTVYQWATGRAAYDAYQMYIAGAANNGQYWQSDTG